jgi:hypothetical protein
MREKLITAAFVTFAAAAGAIVGASGAGSTTRNPADFLPLWLPPWAFAIFIAVCGAAVALRAYRAPINARKIVGAAVTALFLGSLVMLLSNAGFRELIASSNAAAAAFYAVQFAIASWVSVR